MLLLGFAGHKTASQHPGPMYANEEGHLMESPQDEIGKVEQVPRAQRFPIRAPLRYRVRGERTWREGSVENVSVSGLLFRGERLVDAQTPIELSFILPVKPGGDLGARVVGRAMIVRSPADPSASGTPSMAAAIIRSRLVRR